MQPSTVISFDVVKAREAVRKAKQVLAEAEEQLERSPWAVINLPGVNRIRAAERRLQKAQAELRLIDPTSTEQ
jgi:hypothetical protein